MVYRGKPSAGCGECRKRRSRCDQAVPCCGQCTKAGRICPGYRNTLDLMFHDESTQIVHKNKRRVFSNVKSSSSGNFGTVSRNQANTNVVTAPLVKLTDFVMYQPLDELGVNFFMSHYVGNDPADAQLYYLPAFYAQTGYTNPGLQQSIIAAGLAGYAKTARRKDMIDIATKSYITAVRGINTALSNPKTAAQDATIMSIIMAAIFEILIIPHALGMRNCSRHLEGAVSVAYLHLKHGRQTDVTRKLLTTLVQSVIINSWVQHIPLPKGFTELKKQIDEKGSEYSVHGAFLDIVMELVTFRHALQDGTYESPMVIIRKALEIDITLHKFAKNMPRNDRFKSFRISSVDIEELAYEGYYHVYPQRFTAHLWNNIRSSRLRLHQVVLRQCQVLRSGTSSDKYNFLSTQQSESEAQIQALAIEIAATVPQLVGYEEQLGLYRVSAEQDLQGRDKTSPTIPQPRESYLVENFDAPTVDSNPRLAIKSHTNLIFTPVASSSSSGDDENELATPSISQPHSASLYHMLFQLYALRSIPHLPISMKRWFNGRIAWMERNADPKDLAQLQSLLKKRPGGGFPVGQDEGNATVGRSVHETAAMQIDDVGDRSIWLSVYNWYSVGWERLGSQGSNDDWWQE